MGATPFDTYETALQWLFSATDYERMRRLRYNTDTFDLSRMEALLSRLGSPHREGRYLHVAGTKGKGSTAHMVGAVLTAAGHRVGLYTSPHVVDLRERIRVDCQLIEPNDLRDLLGAVRPHVQASAATGDRPATFFEILTAAALVHFRNIRTDAAVLEVGLGGRLDATNVVTPLVAAITSLSLDHVEQLGRTLPEIAFEKAGIIKPGVPVVSASQADEAMAVVERVAAERGAPLWVVGREIQISDYEPDARGAFVGCRLTVRTPRGRHDDLWLPLAGRHQAMNAAVAIGMLERAGEMGVTWDARSLRAGLARAAPAARIEVLGRAPLVINDGAHNPASIRALVAVIQETFPHDRLILVFASATDKDYAGGLAEILPLADHLILTSSGSARAAPPEVLRQAVQASPARGHRPDAGPLPIDLEPDARAAADRALTLAGPDDLVCFTGSFYLAGLIAEWWQARRQAPAEARSAGGGG